MLSIRIALLVFAVHIGTLVLSVVGEGDNLLSPCRQKIQQLKNASPVQSQLLCRLLNTFAFTSGESGIDDICIVKDSNVGFGGVCLSGQNSRCGLAISCSDVSDKDSERSILGFSVVNVNVFGTPGALVLLAQFLDTLDDLQFLSLDNLGVALPDEPNNTLSTLLPSVDAPLQSLLVRRPQFTDVLFADLLPFNATLQSVQIVDGLVQSVFDDVQRDVGNDTSTAPPAEQLTALASLDVTGNVIVNNFDLGQVGVLCPALVELKAAGNRMRGHLPLLWYTSPPPFLSLDLSGNNDLEGWIMPPLSDKLLDEDGLCKFDGTRVCCAPELPNCMFQCEVEDCQVPPEGQISSGQVQQQWPQVALLLRAANATLGSSRHLHLKVLGNKLAMSCARVGDFITLDPWSPYTVAIVAPDGTAKFAVMMCVLPGSMRDLTVFAPIGVTIADNTFINDVTGDLHGWLVNLLVNGNTPGSLFPRLTLLRMSDMSNLRRLAGLRRLILMRKPLTFTAIELHNLTALNTELPLRELLLDAQPSFLQLSSLSATAKGRFETVRPPTNYAPPHTVIIEGVPGLSGSFPSILWSVHTNKIIIKGTSLSGELPQAAPPMQIGSGQPFLSLRDNFFDGPVPTWFSRLGVCFLNPQRGGRRLCCPRGLSPNGECRALTCLYSECSNGANCLSNESAVMDCDARGGTPVPIAATPKPTATAPPIVAATTSTTMAGAVSTGLMPPQTPRWALILLLNVLLVLMCAGAALVLVRMRDHRRRTLLYDVVDQLQREEAEEPLLSVLRTPRDASARQRDGRGRSGRSVRQRAINAGGDSGDDESGGSEGALVARLRRALSTDVDGGQLRRSSASSASSSRSDDDDDDIAFVVGQGNGDGDDDDTAALAFASTRTMALESFVIDASEIEMGKRLGEGAFGIVWRGRWRTTPVAIKQVKLQAATEKELEEFRNEAARLARLRPHPNVVAFYGVVLKPMLAIVCKLCAGGALDAVIYSARAITREEKYVLIRGIAHGVEHLHAEGVIHRDLAARNVLLETSALTTPLITDFGMSRESDKSGDTYQTKTTVGPIKWMAPEQLQRLQYSYKSDIYAFGVLCYEVIERRKPWAGVSLADVAHRVRSGERLRIGGDEQHYASWLRALLEQCWAFNARERPSMTYFVEQIDRASRSDWKMSLTAADVRAAAASADVGSPRSVATSPIAASASDSDSSSMWL